MATVQQLPDGVYDTSDLDDELEIAQANAAAKALGVTGDELYAINLMDCIDFDVAPGHHEGIEVPEDSAYNMTMGYFGTSVVVVPAAVANDDIGLFVTKENFNKVVSLTPVV